MQASGGGIRPRDRQQQDRKFAQREPTPVENPPCAVGDVVAATVVWTGDKGMRAVLEADSTIKGCVRPLLQAFAAARGQGCADLNQVQTGTAWPAAERLRLPPRGYLAMHQAVSSCVAWPSAALPAHGRLRLSSCNATCSSASQLMHFPVRSFVPVSQAPYVLREPQQRNYGITTMPAGVTREFMVRLAPNLRGSLHPLWRTRCCSALPAVGGGSGGTPSQGALAHLHSKASRVQPVSGSGPVRPCTG